METARHRLATFAVAFLVAACSVDLGNTKATPPPIENAGPRVTLADFGDTACDELVGQAPTTLSPPTGISWDEPDSAIQRPSQPDVWVTAATFDFGDVTVTMRRWFTYTYFGDSEKMEEALIASDASGTSLWTLGPTMFTVEAAGPASLVISVGGYVSCAGEPKSLRHLHVIDVRTGATRWTTVIDVTGTAEVGVADGKVWVYDLTVDGTPTYYAWDLDTGAPVS